MDPDEGIHQVEPADQINSLIDEERMEILESCLDQLDPDDRELISYMLANPEATTNK